PDVAVAHAARGLLLQWVDFNWTGALAEYQRAVELAPADGPSPFSLARMLGTLGHTQQAIEMLRQAMTIDPRNGATWLGWDLAALGQFEEAEQAARKVVELVPGSPFVAAGLVMIQIQRGETGAAKVTAQQIP